MPPHPCTGLQLRRAPRPHPVIARHYTILLQVFVLIRLRISSVLFHFDLSGFRLPPFLYVFIAHWYFNSHKVTTEKHTVYSTLSINIFDQILAYIFPSIFLLKPKVSFVAAVATGLDTLYCPLAPYPFLGVNCSDGIGGQVPYSAIMLAPLLR